ncbi:hypothetical protein [Arsukibacterium indicum]|uniref:Uncharacterized protein n=1 Tax=Arsukibacterium indicum TaxID=2848612 RepID=A0ABS6MGJ7_9GAMM|nr:hypothetical protein [Arsukibacterium indicum]MBV2127919.1 hypothetical protein [Arsukibacterium indicum]
MIIDTIEVADDFERTDAYYTGFVASKEYVGSGAMLIELAQQQAGEPITLNSGNFWIKKSVVDALLAHARLGLESFSITLPDTTVKTVMWDYESGDPVSAQPLRRETYPTANSNMVNVQLKFITV